MNNFVIYDETKVRGYRCESVVNGGSIEITAYNENYHLTKTYGNLDF